MKTNKQTPTCFLIDDDDDDKDFLIEALDRLNPTFTCLRARDGAEAVRMLSSGDVHPELILLDLNMPIMAGVDCLRELRKIQHLDKVPIYIYTTAHCSQAAIEKMIAAGARKVLTKPPRMNDLVRLIAGLLDLNGLRKLSRGLTIL